MTDAVEQNVVPLSNQCITSQCTLHSLSGKLHSTQCCSKLFAKSNINLPNLSVSGSNQSSPCATVDLSIEFDNIQLDWIDGKINKCSLITAQRSSLQAGAVVSIIIKSSTDTLQSFYGCAVKTNDENDCLLIIGSSLVSIQQNMFISVEKRFEYYHNKVIYQIPEKSGKIVSYRHHSYGFLQKVVPDTYPIKFFRKTSSTNSVCNNLSVNQLNEDNLLVGFHTHNGLYQHSSPITFSKSCQTALTSSTATQTDVFENNSSFEHSQDFFLQKPNGTLSLSVKISSSPETMPDYTLLNNETLAISHIHAKCSTTGPIPVLSSASTPMQAICSTATPMQAMTSTATPMQAMASTATPMQVMSSTATPMQVITSTATHMQAIVSPSTPMSAIMSTATPMQAIMSTATPMQVMSSTVTPIQAMSCTVTPTQEVYSTALPIQEQFSTVSQKSAAFTAASYVPAMSTAAFPKITMPNNAPFIILMPKIDAPLQPMSITTSQVNAMSTALQSCAAMSTGTPIIIPTSFTALELIEMTTGAVPAGTLPSGSAPTLEMHTSVSPMAVSAVASLVKDMPTTIPFTKEMSSFLPIKEISTAAPLIKEIFTAPSSICEISTAAPPIEEMCSPCQPIKEICSVALLSNTICSVAPRSTSSPPVNEIFANSTAMLEISNSLPTRKTIAEPLLVKDRLVESVPVKGTADKSVCDDAFDESVDTFDESIDAFNESMSKEDSVNELLPGDDAFCQLPPAEEGSVADSIKAPWLPNGYLMTNAVTIKDQISLDVVQTVPRSMSSMLERSNDILTTFVKAESNFSAEKSVSKANIPSTSNDNHPINAGNSSDGYMSPVTSFKQELSTPFVIDGLQCSSPIEGDANHSETEVETGTAPCVQPQQDQLLKGK